MIYWGHISGKTGKIKTNYALAKVHRAKTSRHYSAFVVAQRLSQAKTLIRRRRYGDAVVCLTGIPQLGFAFASKVCAFISGNECGVIDSVIVRQHPEFGFQTRNGYVQNTQHNAAAYNQYCKYLQAEAQKLNRCGLRARWKDRDGSLHRWRAVDVERALYG